MLNSLIEFLLGEEVYLKWLSEQVLPSQMENFTLIDQSNDYSPLIIDPYHQTDSWISKNYQSQIIHLDDKFDSMKTSSLSPLFDTFSWRFRSNHEIVMTIEQSFLSGSKLYLKNCSQLDSLLYPLAQWKSTSNRNENSDGSISFDDFVRTFLWLIYSNCLIEDTNLILYCGRRLFVHRTFHYLLHIDENSFENVSSLLLLLTSPINCQYTVETFLDDARQIFFERLQPKMCREKYSLLNLILHCQQRIDLIDSFLQLNSIRFNFVLFE